MITETKKRIAIVGGTGDLGMGLAARLANRYEVIIGSREASRANEAATRINSVYGGQVLAKGKTNEEAVKSCDLAIIAVRDVPADGLLSSLKQGLRDKLVISPIVPMVFNKEEGFFSIVSKSSDSAAEQVASLLKDTTTYVAGAFHTVPAQRLLDLAQELSYDVLVTANSRDTFNQVVPVVSSVSKLRPLYAGNLRASRTIEAITPLILNTGRLNKIKAPSIKIM